MTTMTTKMQRAIDAHFARIMKQELSPNHKTVLSQQLQAMTVNPRTTFHSFSLFQQTVSENVILERRNELTRAFMSVLRNNEWTEEDSQHAIPVMNWLLSLKKGKNTGGYLQTLRELILLANNKLAVPQIQKDMWKEFVALRPVHCPARLGEQSTNALPRPSLRATKIRD